MTRRPVWVGLDVGGTKVLAGVVEDDGRVRRTVLGTTPGRNVVLVFTGHEDPSCGGFAELRITGH